ncbi:MAG: type VI secretion system-associated FHA domain protein TagH [Candidatus Competibacteraceae bacterium]|nr:type VI secretion system-associated FHA domain protein TagH [Candidatus Competibacteraceae bacterium]
MPLKLTITSYQRLSPGQETTKILDRGSLSIGRAAHADWILQDPERILSGKHCTLHHQDGDYHLTDNSTNGTFLNDSEQRIPRNQTVKLHDGDRFVLGEYEIAATLLPGAAALAEIEPEGPVTDIVPSPGFPSPSGLDLLDGGGAESGGGAAQPGKPSFADLFSEDSLGLKHPPGSPPPGQAITEPSSDLLAPDRAFFEPPALIPETPSALTPAPSSSLLDRPAPAVVPEPMAPMPDWQPPEPPDQIPTESPDARPAASQPPANIVEPVAGPIIPEDWWMASPATPNEARSAAEPPLEPPWQSPASTLEDARPVAPEPPAPGFGEPVGTAATSAPRPPLPTPPLSTPPLPAPASTPKLDVQPLIHAFLEGAGLRHARLNEDQLPEIMANLGAIFRETVRGLMEILLARGDIKGEFRLDRTAIGPVENNPLKTPPGQPPLRPEEVMILLLIGQKGAYMSPVQAVREGFNDIKAHQLAVMAGIQAALARLLERFDPDNLENRLKPNVLDNILPGSRKAKYWDLFTSEYQTIAREAEDDFNELFGDEFARAYEERLRGR